MDQRDYDAVVRRVEAVSGIDVQILGEVEGLPVLRASAGREDAPVVYINGNYIPSATNDTTTLDSVVVED